MMKDLWVGPRGDKSPRRLKPALQGAAIVLIVTSAMLAGCGGSLARRGPIDPALTVFVGPDTVALAGVRMDQLRAAPIYRKLGEANRLPRFDQFRTDSGFDPSRDIHELLL